MIKNKDEKSLIKFNEKNMFYTFKNFFIHLFNRNKENLGFYEQIDSKLNIENRKNNFIKDIRNIDNEETKLLKLQAKYRSGEIKEEELTQEQIDLLCSLYDTQIIELKKSIEHRKKRILEYKKHLTNF